MGKAINAFVEKAPDNDTQVIKLSILDFLTTTGVREKTVIKVKKRDPQIMVVTEVRKVTYLYDKKTSVGYETVKEESVPRDAAGSLRVELKIVGEITRDLRTPGYVEPVKRSYNEEYDG